ncbi:MAG: SEC-C domain-containing protein, partial [Planctomycetales bacterium]|nr:SEC-C domain-containing protein [Planctomycetales bacterium]
VESFYTAGNMEWPHLIDNALRAHYLYKRDVNYVVKEGRVVIVDEFTGRLMEGRQWSDGLHQAVEAKEGVKIKEETQTLATITLQNFFKLYEKISGMTGTAMTEAGEFWKIYKLDVVAIPTNRPMQRIESPDLIFCTEEEKYKAIADDIERTNRWDVLVAKDRSERWGTIVREEADGYVFEERGSSNRVTVPKDSVTRVDHKGRPVLVGTTSIEKSELISSMLEKRGIKHQVLNAKHHKREAEIVAQAGRRAAVTIATNMAGRGTDIILGGNPETMAWAILQDKYQTRLDVPREEWDALVHEIEQREKMKEEGSKLKELGGLHVIGTERHEARRIDLQLRGRCGRQGDPGSSRFYLSLRDDLMRIFAGQWVEKAFKTMGMAEGEAIESPMVPRQIESAQKRVEERHFEARKNLLEYDEVMDEQRKRVYGYRQRILDGVNCKELILEMIERQVRVHTAVFLARDYGAEAFAAWAGQRLATTLDPKDFRGSDIESASREAIDVAEDMAADQIREAIEENLPYEEDMDQWNWAALAKFVDTRWGMNLRDRDLKKIGRDGVEDYLTEKAVEAIRKVDLSDGAQFLERDFGLLNCVGWVRHKFGFEVDIEEIRDKDAATVTRLINEKAAAQYDQKEAEYPVLAGIYRFSQKTANGPRIDRDALLAWARDRFQIQMDADAFRSKQRDEIMTMLVDASRQQQKVADTALASISQKVQQTFRDVDDDASLRESGIDESAIKSLTSWAEQELKCAFPDGQHLMRMTREEVHQRMVTASEDRYRPEIRRMERSLVLQLVDTAWKDHLLAMDHLRSAVGLVGYAQVDPKVEYKREGMRLFEQMWNSLGERVTDLVFRMEQLDEGFVGSTFVETEAKHEQAPSGSEIAQQQQAAIEASQQSGEGETAETIRNRNDRVGRNDPCPCGSGKKYKNC